MTTPTPLTPERERAIVQTLIDFLDDGWELYIGTDGSIDYWPGTPFEMRRIEDGVEEFANTPSRSADTLRLVEERLTPEQWMDYVAELDKAMDADAAKAYAYDDFSIGVVWALSAPVASRAAALAEVVGP